MKRIAFTFKLFWIWVLPLTIVACGGNGSPSAGSGATAVTITLKVMETPPAAGRLLLTDPAPPVPLDVTQIRIIIAGEHMETIQRSIDVAGKSEIKEGFKVRSGSNRHFLALALASDGKVLYQGHRYEDLVGKPKLVEILMGVDISGEWTAYHRPQGGAALTPDYISFSQAGNFLTIGGDFRGSGTITGYLINLEFVPNLCGENVTVTGVLGADGKTVNGTYEASGGCLPAPETGILKVIRGKQTAPPPTSGTLSNSDLSGPWMWLSKAGNVIFVFDGKGGILDVGVFNALLPTAGYHVLPDGSFNISLDFPNNPSKVLSGILTSATAGILTAPGGGTGSLIKVTELSSCQGGWTGTLRESAGTDTFNIAFIIDSNGMVTSFSGFAQPVSGRMLCESGNLAGYFRTGEPLTNPYSQIQISGKLSGNNVTGIFFTDTTAGFRNGSVSLVSALSLKHETAGTGLPVMIK